MEQNQYHMKKVFLLTGITLLTMWACNSVSNEKTTCSCAENKDSYEIVMNIPVKVKPEFVSAYKTAFDKCRAETLKEEACKAYDLFQSYSDSTEFHLYELWTNKPGHQNHMQTTHLKKYFEEINGMTVQAAKSKVVTVCPEVN